MVTNASVAGVGPDVSTEKKQNFAEADSDRIEAPPIYAPENEDAEKDASEEINYHTLTWWYVAQQ